MPAIIYILVAGILGCLFAMIVVAVRDGGNKPLPVLETQSLMGKKELAMYNDLKTVCLKVNLQVAAKVPLSLVVQAQEEKRRYALQKRLRQETLPFLLLNFYSGKPVMVILNADYQSELGLQVMDAAKIPYLKLNNYNLPGLEKAIRDKLEGALPAAGKAQEDKELVSLSLKDRS